METVLSSYQFYWMGNLFLDRILVKINYYNDTKLMILFNIAKYLIKHDSTEGNLISAFL